MSVDEARGEQPARDVHLRCACRSTAADRDDASGIHDDVAYRAEVAVPVEDARVAKDRGHRLNLLSSRLSAIAGTIDRMSESVRIVPANQATWDDVRAIFGARGTGQRCFCQRYKLHRRESFGSFPDEERAERMREQTEVGNPESETTSGLVAYVDDEPVGWCAVEPRPSFHGLVRNNRVPWEGRDEDPADETVWAVTCLFVRAGYRKQGISAELACGRRGTRAGARSAGAGGVPDGAQPGDPGGAARRHDPNLRSGRAVRGQQAHAATGGDEDRLRLIKAQPVLRMPAAMPLIVSRRARSRAGSSSPRRSRASSCDLQVVQRLEIVVAHLERACAGSGRGRAAATSPVTASTLLAGQLELASDVVEQLAACSSAPASAT